MKKQTSAYDSSEHLTTESDYRLYLESAFEQGDPRLIQIALGNITKAKGMTQIARATGLRRESLVQALAPDGNPEFSTVLDVLKALGYRLQVTTMSVPTTL